MMLGVHPLAPMLLAMIGVEPGSLGRLRDCYLGRGPDGELEIHVFTRNGGGNREHFRECDPGLECGCTGCVITHNVPLMPGYIRDFDDPFDSTYATIAFRIPERFADGLAELVRDEPEVVLPPFKERFDAMMKRIKSDPNDPAAVRGRAVLEPLLQRIMEKL